MSVRLLIRREIVNTQEVSEKTDIVDEETLEITSERVPEKETSSKV